MMLMATIQRDGRREPLPNSSQVSPWTERCYSFLFLTFCSSFRYPIPCEECPQLPLRNEIWWVVDNRGMKGRNEFHDQGLLSFPLSPLIHPAIHSLLLLPLSMFPSPDLFSLVSHIQASSDFLSLFFPHETWSETRKSNKPEYRIERRKPLTLRNILSMDKYFGKRFRSWGHHFLGRGGVQLLD